VTGFPGLRVLRRLRHTPRASADSAPCPAATAARRARGASHVHCDPLDRIGIWLYPCNTSREHSQRLSGHHAHHLGRGADRLVRRQTRCCTRPTSARFQVASLIKGLQPPVRSRYASRPCSHARGRLAVPPGRTSSGRSTTTRASTPRSPSASTGCCISPRPAFQPARRVASTTDSYSISHSASWRTSPSR